MALPKYGSVVQDTSGNVVSGAEVTIIDTATGLNADLYSDRAGSVATGNPLTTNAQGEFSFFAAPGSYRANAVQSGTGFTATKDYIPLLDPEANAFTSSISCSASVSTNEITLTPLTDIYPAEADGLILFFRLPTYTSTGATTIKYTSSGVSRALYWNDNSTNTASDDIDSTYNKTMAIQYIAASSRYVIISDIAGNNANGYWTRYSNGDQRCRNIHGSALTTSNTQGSWYYNTQAFTFPKAFSAAPNVNSISINGGGINGAGESITPTTTTVSIRVIGAAVTNTATPGYVAHGRWY